MTEKQIRALMCRAIMKPIVIFCPTTIYAESFRDQLRHELTRLFPALVNTYITTGQDIFVKGYEKITVTTVPLWNEFQKKQNDLFKGYAYCTGCTIDDIFGVKNLMYEPERLDGI